MSNRRIVLRPLTADAFAPFGDVLEATGEPDKIINAGMCGRFHDLANLDFSGENARAGISLFRSKARTLPYTLDMVERHPLGSQGFIPMSADPFMVIVAPDDDGAPGTPLAFLTDPGQGVNYHRNTWHGVLTPLVDDALFAVVDRIGDGNNLEEHVFDKPWLVHQT
ncbi:MAG: ureidoglycolate lyase [Anderseniella sp.]